MNKSESKYFNTALCMNEALISLLEVKDLEYITVTEICKKAGVNRSTFYLHYETISDLLNEAMDNVTRRFISYFEQDANDYIAKLNGSELKELVFVTQDYLHPFLKFVSENKSIYRASFRNPDNLQANTRYGSFKKYIIEPILEKFGVPEAFRQYLVAYYMGGIAAIIREWLNNNCSDPIETIAAIIEECVVPSNVTEDTV